MIVAYYLSDKIDSNLQAFECEDEYEALSIIISAARSLVNSKILDTASNNLKKKLVDAALQDIDVWVEEFTSINPNNVFKYTIEE
jgi:hypothetical protein